MGSLTFSDVRRGRILDVSLDMRLTIEDTGTISSRDDVKCAFGFGTSKENTERSLKRALRRSNASVFGAKKLFSTCKRGCCRQRRCGCDERCLCRSGFTGKQKDE